jgi:hypothetical protein
MNHNYRQASKTGFLRGEGYHISLQTILNERGLTPQKRVRDNVADVRRALQEMKQRRILREMQPYEERLTRAKTKRRPVIIDAVWTLYPSTELIEEIIKGNVEMASVRQKAGGGDQRAIHTQLEVAK